MILTFEPLHNLCFPFQLDEKSGCYGSVKFSLTYNEKIGTSHLLLGFCRYSFLGFTKIILV